MKHIHFLSALPDQAKTITDALFQWRFTRDDLSKRVDRPSCGRVIGHVEVSNLACSYLHDDKHVENSKASRHDDKEIAG